MDFNRTTIIIVVAAFFLGLLFGYGIIGEKETKEVSAKEMLKTIVTKMDTLEAENKKLQSLKDSKNSQITSETKSLKANLERSTKSNQELKKALDQTQSQLNEAQAKFSLSESKLKSNEVLMTLTDELKTEISQLEKENAELKMTLETIGSLSGVKPSDSAAPVQEEQPAAQDNGSEKKDSPYRGH